MRLAILLLIAVTAACVPSRGLDRTGRGAPAALDYAPPGTRLVLRNAINGDVSESRITAGLPIGPRGAYVAEDGTPGGFYPGCFGCGGAMRIDEAGYLGLWPLETGKIVRFLRTAPDGRTARVVVRVVGFERIITAAGSFDTYLLDGRVEHLDGPRFSAQVRAWWAPNPGWVVRAEGGDSQGNTLSSEVIKIITP